MTDFQDTRRWRDLARLIPQIIQKLQDFAGDSSRTSFSRASIEQAIRAIELMAAPFGDILAVYWPDSYECPNWDHALMVIGNQNDPAGRRSACATAIHKLTLLQRQLETTSERKPQQPDQNPTGPGQLSATTGEADAGFLQNPIDSQASSLRKDVERMDYKQERQW